MTKDELSSFLLTTQRIVTQCTILLNGQTTPLGRYNTGKEQACT
jgi:hypothetical protein